MSDLENELNELQEFIIKNNDAVQRLEESKNYINTVISDFDMIGSIISIGQGLFAKGIPGAIGERISSFSSPEGELNEVGKTIGTAYWDQLIDVQKDIGDEYYRRALLISKQIELNEIRAAQKTYADLVERRLLLC